MGVYSNVIRAHVMSCDPSRVPMLFYDEDCKMLYVAAKVCSTCVCVCVVRVYVYIVYMHVCVCVCVCVIPRVPCLISCCFLEPKETAAVNPVV